MKIYKIIKFPRFSRTLFHRIVRLFILSASERSSSWQRSTDKNWIHVQWKHLHLFLACTFRAGKEIGAHRINFCTEKFQSEIKIPAVKTHCWIIRCLVVQKSFGVIIVKFSFAYSTRVLLNLTLKSSKELSSSRNPRNKKIINYPSSKLCPLAPLIHPHNKWTYICDNVTEVTTIK